MHRRVVRPGAFVPARLEHRQSTTREISEHKVLNLMQPVAAGTARFTVEGEGANIWVAAESIVLDQTDPVHAHRAG